MCIVQVDPAWDSAREDLKDALQHCGLTIDTALDVQHGLVSSLAKGYDAACTLIGQLHLMLSETAGAAMVMNPKDFARLVEQMQQTLVVVRLLLYW